jgi:hypothetical protein
MVLVVVLAACGGSGGSGAAPGSGPADRAGGGSAAAGGGSAAPGGGSEPGSAVDPARALLPDRIGTVELEAVTYRLPDALDDAGGPQLAAMLGALGLTLADVTLVIAVDRAGLLAIGRWELPGKEAGAILAAWKSAAGPGWQPATLAGEPAIAGRGPDGKQAWAVARDGVFVYVVTEEPQLAEEAVAGTR